MAYRGVMPIPPATRTLRPGPPSSPGRMGKLLRGDAMSSLVPTVRACMAADPPRPAGSSLTATLTLDPSCAQSAKE